MRSDNEIKTMRLNRTLGNWKVIPFLLLGIDLFLFFGFNYIVNTVSNLVVIAKDIENAWDYLGIENILPQPERMFGTAGVLYLFMFFVLIVLDAMFVYQIRTSLSDKELNHGQKGEARWTTQKEVREQYKSVPLRNAFFPGKGGTIVSRQGNRLFIDDSKSNTLVIGTTRSGKGEMYVFPTIDVYSRADKLENRPSMIISDPKMELYRSAKSTLEKRGYVVKLLNLVDPLASMGYNPLQLVIDYYKAGYIEKAQLAARAFAFSVFAADNSTQEPIWKNTATDLFTALIVAVTTDCLEADRTLNEERRKAWVEKREAFNQLEPDLKIVAIQKFKEMQALSEDVLLNEYVSYIPDTIPFTEVYPNEKNISCFSCLNFFRELCDRKAGALSEARDDNEREQILETALDEYFSQRPPLDYAKALYQEIKTAGSKTKGSVYINMQSALSIFALDNIARLTATNDVDFEELGYGKKPVAIFIGIPPNDKSNHFLVTTFVTQVTQFLSELTIMRKGENGKLDRNVRFILDEFGNFPKIEEFPSFVTYNLGLGISYDIYLQSLNQLPEKYGDAAKTILENFANQIYIKSIGKETAEEFSDMLGKRTVIEIQRSGSRTGTDKNFTESAESQPLMYPDDLARLREGECVVYRGIKRTDRLGLPVKSFPIINELADKLGVIDRLKLICDFTWERLIKHKVMDHPSDDENRQLTLQEEWKVRKNTILQKKGTALLYRYQYLTDTFPNPDTVRLDEINKESRAEIDYAKMVYDPELVIRNLSKKQSGKEYRLLEEMPNYYAIVTLLERADPRWQENLKISAKDTISRVTSVVCSSTFAPHIKNELLYELSRR